ncbi:MAG: hypothetical protein ACMUIE_11005 [Thermoplasmatota archaeon]
MEKRSSFLLAALLIASALIAVTDSDGAEPPTRSPGGMLYVSPSGSTYDEVQWAVDNATEGDTIYVAPGNYSQGMVIKTDGITVIGNNTGGEVRIGKFDMGVGAVQASRVNISGLNFTDENDHIGLLAITNSDNLMLKDITIYTEETSSGLFISNSENITAEGLSIRTDDDLPVQIRDTENTVIRDILIISDKFESAVQSFNTNVGLEFEDGVIMMGKHSSTAFVFDGFTNATIINVSAAGVQKYITNDNGTIDIIDLAIQDDLIEQGHDDGRINIWFRKDVAARMLDRIGDDVTARGADLNLTINGETVYSTPFYGGWDERSDAEGLFNGPIRFLSRSFVGLEPVSYGVNSVRAWFQKDHPQGIMIPAADANSTDDLVLLFDEVSRRNGTITGTVTYSGGPMDGEKVANASVDMTNDWFDPVWETNTDLNGSFIFENVFFYPDFNLDVFPPDYVIKGENATGYAVAIVEFNFTDDLDLEIEVEYYEYVPPINGTLNGTVTYKGGPMDGQNAVNATVMVHNNTMSMWETIVDENGTYSFEELPLGLDYILRIVPMDGVTEGGLEEGYLITEILFDHISDQTLNVEIRNYTPPTEGPIYGWVRYEGGPKDGLFAEGARVLLLNMTGSQVGNMTTSTTGYFEFPGKPVGEGYELRITPREDELGINNQATGYLFWDGSAFTHDGDTRINASLKYYRKPVEIRIVDDDGNPVEGAIVTITIGNETYTAETDEDGIAIFDDLEEIPDGAEIEASKEGYETRTWKWPEPTPPLVLSETQDHTLVFILISIFVVIAIAVALFFMFGRRSKEEYEE